MEDDNSSSDSEGVVDETDEGHSLRTKRSVGGTEWCGTNDASPPPKMHVEWPTTTAYYENPNFGQRLQLYSKSNYFLAAYPDGTVRGTQDPEDLHTLFEILNSGEVGHVRIQSLSTGKYIAMNNSGTLYSEEDSISEGTVFIEIFNNAYNAYLSKANSPKSWYIGIKKSGICKPGHKTALHQKAVQFLPVRSKFTQF